MPDLPVNIDSETRFYLAELNPDENPEVVMFVEIREGANAFVREQICNLDVNVMGENGTVMTMRTTADNVARVASIKEVMSVEGWPGAESQRGAHPMDTITIKNVSGVHRIPVLVRFASEPDPDALENMALIGLQLDTGQDGSVRSGTLGSDAIDDALAVPGVEAVKLSGSALSALLEEKVTDPENDGSDLNKVSATTRMILRDGENNRDDPVAVFVEFARTPSPEEEEQMREMDLRIVSGKGTIQTARIPLRNIPRLSNLSCVAAIEASEPLQLDHSKEDEPTMEDYGDVEL